MKLVIITHIFQLSDSHASDGFGFLTILARLFEKF